jgi:histidinol-phosphate aminotransferase
MGHTELIAGLEKIRQPFNINSISQAGAIAALDDNSHVQKTRRINSRGLKFFTREFRKLGLEYLPSGANFILVRVEDGQRVFNEMQKLGVIVRPMGGYQLPEWVRISVGMPKQNDRCIEALKKALEISRTQRP